MYTYCPIFDSLDIYLIRAVIQVKRKKRKKQKLSFKVIKDIYSTKERASFQKYIQKNQNDTQLKL